MKKVTLLSILFSALLLAEQIPEEKESYVYMGEIENIVECSGFSPEMSVLKIHSTSTKSFTIKACLDHKTVRLMLIETKQKGK